MNECSACRVEFYFNPDVRMMHSSVCDHRVCEPCVARLFRRGPYKCPACDRQLSAQDFSYEPREAKQVDAEVRIRRQLAEIFNKTEEDFASAAEYDDYLDRTEEIIFRLTNPSSQDEVQETWREINAYQAQNAEQIKRSQRMAPRRKFQKIMKIMQEEGTFFEKVNIDVGAVGAPGFGEGLTHPFAAKFSALLSNPPQDRSRSPSPMGGCFSSPGLPRQTSWGSPAPVRDLGLLMSGGGHPSDACMKKARHFFFEDLVAATSSRAAGGSDLAASSAHRRLLQGC